LGQGIEDRAAAIGGHDFFGSSAKKWWGHIVP
jgi:hypothetical protein